MEEAVKKCLNCGTELTDAFCPHCGQKASVKRLNVKTAIVDNTWSILRSDRRVLPTAMLLLTRPWVVIRGYIHGHRVAYTQPVRFIVIMCFINIFVQMVVPDADQSQAPQPTASSEETFWLFLWHSVQAFVRDSRVASDLIDSIIFAPIVYVLYLPWGSRRFNLAEYSTAYLYLCGGSLVVDLLTMPLYELSLPLWTLVQIGWWLYVLNGMVKHSFRFRSRFVRTLVIIVNMLVIGAVAVFNHIFLLGEHLDWE